MADAVTVATEHLGQIASQFNENVYVLANCIDLSLLLHQRPVPERTTVGWGGSPGHVIDFESADRGLDAFFSSRPDVDLHTVGWEPPFTFENRRHSPVVPTVMRYLESLDFQIGIAPLAPHVFNLSKSDLRLVEYAALGIPVVASDFGPYSESLQHGETGFLVKQDSDWATYLGRLVDDEHLRNVMSINARLWASTRTIQGNAWKWELAYRETVARVRGGEVTGLRAPLPKELLASV
jgi:glycosyltransferase involved in cell wall biosynthesis